MAIFDLFSKSNRNTINNTSPHSSGFEDACVDPNRPAQTAIIYQSELDYMSRCILDYIDIETGGQLFGYWTATGIPVVLYAIGPGRQAKHNPTSFIQDQDYLQLVGNELYKRYRLQHIGEWHSHHQLGLAHPRGGDVNTMQYGVGKPGFPRLLLCIGNCTRTHTTVNPFIFHENNPREYSQAAWDIVNLESPFRKLADAELRSVLIHPYTRFASHGEMRSTRNVIKDTSSHRLHWLTEKAENVETMKTFVSMVQSMYPATTVKAEILESGEPLISLVEKGLSIKLPYGFPVKSPIVSSTTGDNLSYRNNWEIGEESLTVTFGRWIASILPNIICETLPANEITDEDVYGSERRGPLTKEEKKEYRKAKTRTERIAAENQILSYYFHDAAFAWSDITETPVVNIVAYPFTKGKQCVVRMTLPSDFPENRPSIQIGYYYEDDTPEPTLPKHLSEINYIRLSDLFNGAKVYYSRMLEWTNDSSLLKAYIVACTIVFYSNKANKECRDAGYYLNQFLEDDSKMKDLIKNISEKIKEQKQ